MSEKIKEGWGEVFDGSKYCIREVHYFVNRQSLCHKWLKFQNDSLDVERIPSKDDCKKCIKLLQIRS